MARTRSVRSGFEQRFRAQLRRSEVATGQRLIVGFSGGPDSLALAAALRRVAPWLDLSVTLVHVDHGLRTDSGDDVARCEALAETLEFPFRTVSLETGLPSRGIGIGLEEQGRRERYLALSRIADELDSSTILLGHQANDQAETVLLHLLRGAGLQGLGGMRLVEERAIPWWPEKPSKRPTYRIVRPLLNETRGQIEAYIDELQLEPLIDKTNLQDDFDRNWVRQHVIPKIQERWPAAIETIARSAEVSRLDISLLDSQVAEVAPPIVTDDRTLCTDALLAVEPALAWRVIRGWLVDLGIEDISHDVVVRVYDLARRGDERSTIEVGSGFSIVKDRDCITTLEHLLETAHRSIPMAFSDGQTSWFVEMGVDRELANVEILVPSSLELRVRTLRPGDRWFGAKRVVAEDLRVASIHPHLRNRLLAVTTEDGVLLIPAIYPTIRSEVDGLDCKQVGVRWRSGDQRLGGSAKTKGSNGS